MPDLIAQGPRPQDRWRRPLPTTGTDPVILGRATPSFAVPWDDRISRKHAMLTWDGKSLEVNRLLEARNPVFYRGMRRDQFRIAIGDHFVIGQTTFSLVDQRVRIQSDEPPALTEHTFAASQLRQARYRDADRRIEVLSRLPEIIQGSSTDNELFVRVVNVLMQGIEKASFVAIVADPNFRDRDSLELPPIESTPIHPMPPSDALDATSLRGADDIAVLHWDCRNLTGQHFSPSAQLIRQALATNQSVLHVWSRAVQKSESQSYTQSENVDWAFCSPIHGEACPGWAIYVAGDFGSLSPSSGNATVAIAADLQDDLKFAELASTTLATIRQSRFLQRRQDSLRPFFAPVVLQALASREPDEVLAPRETNVSVLFCDLRGFSKQSEESADRLLELLHRVSDALGVMTHHILAAGGVVGDFHGDAAMGFWGWPFEDTSTVLQACQAALAIQAEFEASSRIENHPLAKFRAGLGIATGRAVAGQIGTTDQVKVTVFGPVVNLASRLESMTKQLQAPILIDEMTAERIRKEVPPSIARTRRVARVQPVGIHSPLMVSELLPPEGSDSILTQAHIDAYERAVDSLQEGNWAEAFRQLHLVPAEDRVKDFLTVFIAQHGRTPPSDWKGYIRLPEK
ncbi:MAG: adenylate/guanylate cyclase domain-containing protein [Pirellulales bacterium]